MQTGMQWAERVFVVSVFLTLLLLAYGETWNRDALTLEDFGRESRALELELLKLRRDALTNDSIPWGERVEAWTEKNRERFETLAVLQDELGIPEEEEVVYEVELEDITDPTERAMVEAQQRLDQALRLDMAEQFVEGDDYTVWIEAWTERNKALVEESERAASKFYQEQWDRVEPIVIEEIDSSEEAIRLADAQERVAEKILELRTAHKPFESFQSALAENSGFFEQQQAIIEAQSKIIEARQLDLEIQQLETHP